MYILLESRKLVCYQCVESVLRAENKRVFRLCLTFIGISLGRIVKITAPYVLYFPLSGTCEPPKKKSTMNIDCPLLLRVPLQAVMSRGLIYFLFLVSAALVSTLRC